VNPYSFSPYKAQWALRGVEVWSSAEAPTLLNVYLENGRVVATEPATEGGRFALIPAGVDMQVHLRVPGQPHKETAETGLLASLMGGLAAVVTMPNTRPVLDTVEALKAAQAETQPWERKFGVRVLFTAALSLGQKGQSLVDYQALADAGVVAFTDDGVGLASDDLMLESLSQLAAVDRPLFQHAETPGHGGVLAPGPVQAKLGVKGYGPEPELSMVKRDLQLLAKVPGAKYHLLHVSSAQSIGLISAAKKSGLQATVEVSPHHLWWSTQDLDAHNPSFKMNPPIRTPEDRQALQVALEQGEIDWVATDHAPHEPEAKTENFDKASFGTVGVETALPVLLALNAQKKLSPRRLVEVFASRPAQYLGLDSRQGWGAIEVGAPLRAVLVDKTAPWVLWKESDFHSLSKNSCFIGTRLPQRPAAHFTESGVFQFLESFPL
jgi:dihydroorotase